MTKNDYYYWLNLAHKMNVHDSYYFFLSQFNDY